MNNQKPLFLMAGGRKSRGKGFGPPMQAVFKEIGKPSPTIAYVGVASEDDRDFYLMISKEIQKSGDCQMDRILIAAKKADLEKARASLEASDAIFMSGGDVEAGIKVLEEKGLTGFFTELYQKGKVFFGVSAGSIMLAKEWVRWRDPEDDSTAEMFPCLGLAPVICDTHAEEDDWEELKAALGLKSENICGYGIPTGSCLKVSHDWKLESIGGPVFQFTRRGDQVVKQENL